jgi:hypothetical protein
VRAFRRQPSCATIYRWLNFRSKTHLLTLYFLDSGAYAKKGWQWWKPTEYDWIHGVRFISFAQARHPSDCVMRQSQRQWFLHESKLIDPIARPFTPDGAKDFGRVWGSSRTDHGANAILAKPNALVFFHIPLRVVSSIVQHGF